MTSTTAPTATTAEYRCTVCDETFLDDETSRHEVRVDGEDCGGLGTRTA